MSLSTVFVFPRPLLKTEVPGLQIVISFLPRNRQGPLPLNLCNQVSEVTHTLHCGLETLVLGQ